MSIFGKKTIVEEPVVVEPKEEAPVVKVEESFKPANVTTIAEGVEMVGDFITSDPMEVKGFIKGNIVSEKDLHVCPNGVLKGDAKVSNLDIDGSVDGTVVVEGLTSLSTTGEMKGSLQTAKFASSPGSVFEGIFSMSIARKKPEAEKTAKTKEKAESKKAEDEAEEKAEK